MRKILQLLFLAVIYSSCIPNKDLIYFQGEPVPRDSIYQLQDKPYRLQVNDMLYIDIKSANPELVQLFKNSTSTQNGNTNNISPEMIYFKSYSVDRHGNIRMPYIGEMNVLGYTTPEVREKIQKKLEEYFINKEDVFITVKLAGIRFTALGEVGRPGTVVVYQNQLNLADAIAAAGDIEITGNRKRVTVLRKSIDKTEKFIIDLTNINAFESEIFYIKPNDIVYVEPLKQKSWGTGTTGMQTVTTLITVLSLVTTTILLIQSFK
ncbi:MAG: sugar transporter [Flavobacteriia bacterium]|nr:MAG: sugar transporter [Flavobacteriia bacterium]